MIKLIILDELTDDNSLSTKFGGRPLVPSHAPFDWPSCNDCESRMQYLGQIVREDKKEIISIFMCESGDACSTWEADGGANLAILVQSKNAKICSPPEDDKNLLRPEQYGTRIEESSCENYDQARVEWAKANGKSPRQVLGQIGGNPLWIQADETPTCHCGKTMEFVAQLEEGPNAKTTMNFGGGCAYLFCCSAHAAKFLWQQ